MNDDWEGGSMGDDSDGADYEDLFGGPDDDEIERKNDFQYRLTEEERQFWFSTVNTEIRRNEFFDYLDAVAYAKNRARAEDKCFIISNTDWGWRVDKDLKTPPEFSNYSLPVPTENRIGTALELIHALREKDLPLAVLLLQQPIEVNTPDSRGVTALMVAAYRGMPEICDKLLRMGATADHFFNNSSVYGEAELSTIERANASGDARTIELIERAYVQERWDSLKTLNESNLEECLDFLGEQLVNAARWGMTSVVVEMIEAGADINYASHGDFYSPLSAAFKSDRRETSLVLVAMGANLEWMKANECITAESVGFESAVTDFRNIFSSIKLSKMFDG